MRRSVSTFMFAWVIAAAVPVCGQTKISLRTQAKDADFADFASTRPVKTGTVLPVTCSTGELFFDTDAGAGENLYGCTATDSWTLQSTNPVAIGSDPPASCSVGELFFDTDAQAGQNVYGCTGVNVWKLLGDGPNVGVALPPTCTPGDLFFDTNATAGENLYGCTAQDTWMVQGDGGAADGREVKSNGVPVGTRPTNDYLSGEGIVTTLADTGSEITIQHAVNTAVIESRANAQAGTNRYCASSAGSDAYGCSLTPVLTAYTTGMVVTFKPDVNNTGAATLEVDTLGAKAIKVIRGGAKVDPSNDDIDADWIYTLAYDGVDFLVTAGMETTKAGEVAPKSSQYLVLATDPDLTDERVISPQGALQIQDMGAGGNYNLYYAVTSTQSQAWDDFLLGGFTSQNVGTLGWRTVGGDITPASSVPNHPGIITLTAANTPDSTHYMHLGGDTGAYGSFAGLDTTTDWDLIFVFQTVDSIAETKFTIGLASDAAGDPDTDGLWVRFWDSTGCTNNGADAAWVYESCSAGSCSTQPGPPIAADTWYTLRMRNDGTSGTIKYSMKTNGGSWSTEASIATDVPSAALLPVFKVMQCGSETRSLQVDAYGHTLRNLSR